MILYTELTEREKRGLQEFLTLTFYFTDEELKAIDRQRPMTQELFNSCLEKCMRFQTNRLFYELLEEYPDFLLKYAKAIEEEINDTPLLPKTPHEEEESWSRLCKRIRDRYGKGGKG